MTEILLTGTLLSLTQSIYLLVETYVLGTQKNCLNETVLLSIHNINFG